MDWTHDFVTSMIKTCVANGEHVSQLNWMKAELFMLSLAKFTATTQEVF